MATNDMDAILEERSSGSPVTDQAWRSFRKDFATTRDILCDSPLYNRTSDTRTSPNVLLYQLLYVGHSLTLQRMVVYHGFCGDESRAQMAEMRIDNFELNPDGTFEMIISADNHDGNWIKIDRNSRNVPIMLRQNHPIGRTRLMRNGMWIEVHMANMSRFSDRLVLNGTHGKYNAFFDLTGPAISKHGTFNRAHYGNAVYDFARGEAPAGRYAGHVRRAAA